VPRSEGELQLRRYLRSQRALTEQLLEKESLDQVAAGFLSTVAGLLHWDAGAIWEVVDWDSPLRFVTGWSVADLDAEPLWKLSRSLSFERGIGLPGRAWHEGEIVWVSDVDEERDFPRRPAANEVGTRAALAIPVPMGRPEGVLAIAEFHTRSLTTPADELVDLLATFADQLAAFIARRETEAAAREAEEFSTAVVRGTQDAVLSKDLDGIVTSWNPAAQRLYGYTPEEAIGRHISFIVPADHRGEEREILDRVCRGERIETYETERIRKDGARLDVSLTISPIERPLLGIVGASVVARDITAEKRRRRAQEFLVAASRALDASLDVSETARTIVDTAVPDLATLCLIDFVRKDGLIGDSVVAGTEPSAARRLEKVRNEAPLDPNGEHPVAQVLREGRPMVWRDLTSPEVMAQVAQNEEHRQLMSDAGYNSAAVVALVARGRTLGALSFLHAHSDLRYDAADLELLTELADRAAIALDNARLYRERDETARNLQRGLRPPRPAEVPGLEISVVFEAAGEGIEIGGDLYDVLPTEDGCWILIGDVAGKGSAAAGVSVSVRHAVRGLTREIDDPEEVLARVNELLIEGTTLNDFATALLIRMSFGAEGWRATLAGAGHPPAIHLTSGGPVQLGGGSVLGAFPESRLERHEVVVEAGDTLVLCTDGWLEAGPAEAHRHPEALAEMAQRLSRLELDELIERLCRDAISRGGGTLRDDMVVLAVRPGDDSPARRDAGSARRERLSPL
jgi:PAS domain S-box-containing protein